MEADGPECTRLHGFRSAYADAVGDLSLMTAEWGPSVGLTQTRVLRDPHTGNAADAWRIARLLIVPELNAQAAYWISRRGTYFDFWTMYRNGMWKPEAGKDFQVVWGHPHASQWNA